MGSDKNTKIKGLSLFWIEVELANPLTCSMRRHSLPVQFDLSLNNTAGTRDNRPQNIR